MIKLTFTFLLLGISVALGGCQLGISGLVAREDLIKPDIPSNMSINLLSTLRDVRPSRGNYVGRHTFTLFMIPTFDVKVENGELDELIPMYVKEALETSGYTVTTVDELSQAGGSHIGGSAR